MGDETKPQAEPQVEPTPEPAAAITAAAEGDDTLKALSDENESLKAQLEARDVQLGAKDAELQAFARERLEAAVAGEVDAWRFTEVVYDAEGRKVGDVPAGLVPAHQEVAKAILLTAPDETAEKFREIMASGGFQFAGTEELATLHSATATEKENQKADEEFVAGLPEDTRQKVADVQASQPELSARQAFEIVLRQEYPALRGFGR